MHIVGTPVRHIQRPVRPLVVDHVDGPAIMPRQVLAGSVQDIRMEEHNGARLAGIGAGSGCTPNFLQVFCGHYPELGSSRFVEAWRKAAEWLPEMKCRQPLS
jgi:hypothetical protein